MFGGPISGWAFIRDFTVNYQQKKSNEMDCWGRKYTKVKK